MTEAELRKCIEWMDKRKERGGDHGNQHTGGKVAKRNLALCQNPPSKPPRPLAYPPGRSSKPAPSWTMGMIRIS